jgi:DNA-binding NarL/FixJ family response regulator
MDGVNMILESSSRPRAAGHAPCIVIHQRATLCAEALDAVVRKHTPWQVACATTSMHKALRVMQSRAAMAMLFDVPTGPGSDAAALIRRLRLACPETALILLTAQEELDFLTAGAAACLNAIVHQRDSVADFAAALRSVQSGDSYRSPIICGLHRRRLDASDERLPETRQGGYPPRCRS